MPNPSGIHIRLAFFCLFVGFSIAGKAEKEPDTSLYRRAESLVNSGKYNQALEMYQLFINSGSPDETDEWEMISQSWNNSGVCHFVLQEYDKAAISFENALDIDREYRFDTYPERLSNLGRVYKEQGFYDAAITCYEEALRLAEENGNRKNVAVILNNIGSIYKLYGIYDKALEFHEKSLRIKQEIGDEQGRAYSLNNIGMVYYDWQKYQEALRNFEEALAIEFIMEDKALIAKLYNNLGLVFFELEEYDSASLYYHKALDMNIESGLKGGVAAQYNNLGMMYLKRKDYDQAGKFLVLALDTYEDLNLRTESVQVLSNLGYNEGLRGNYSKAFNYLKQSVDLATELNLADYLKNNYLRLSDIYEKTGAHNLALDYFKRASEIKDSLFTSESHRQIAGFEVKYESERKQKEIEISNLKLKRQKTFKNSLLGIVSLILVMTLVVFYFLRLRTRDNRIIQSEKMKSDRLLLNVLPEKVAEDLKNSGVTVPESFEEVSVLFTDLCNFTELSAGLTPEYIIEELNQVFSMFDSIIEKHHCERIKTIGDAYMAVCGLPLPDPDHAVNIVSAALEILDYMEERRKLSPVKWQIRIGIDSGKVVAGVVGVKKYIYDVFGDTVNTASRMQSISEPMKINVTEKTYLLVKDAFHFTERDAVNIKGKGEMKMYFVDR